MSGQIGQRLKNIYGDALLVNEPMSRHTTFRIGGAAGYLVMPRTRDELAQTIRACRQEQVPFYIIGNGSNLLVSDAGYEGVIIQIYQTLNSIEIDGDLAVITAGAGALLVKIAKMACAAGLTGLEFASGIPGTVGGAVVMNAGAYGGEMKDIVSEVTVMDQDGRFYTLQAGQLDFGYRHSAIAAENLIVVEVRLQLKVGEHQKIESSMKTLAAARKEKQPLEYPSAGSTFKRPEGYFAGKLIMDAGLRGFTVGGAQVSEKHCGFVINKGGATAQDVRTLIREVTRIVEAQAGVRLEPEVKMLGDFEEPQD